MPKPDLVLASGSQRFLSDSSLSTHEAPIRFAHEFSKDSSLIYPEFRMAWHKHNMNGGYANWKLRFGFKNLKMLPKAYLIERSLGDFLDYSGQPSHVIKNCKHDSKIHLHKDSCLTRRTLIIK